MEPSIESTTPGTSSVHRNSASLDSVTKVSRRTKHVNVEWPSFEAVPYPRHPRGVRLQVFPQDGSGPCEWVSSEFIVMTKGSSLALRGMNGPRDEVSASAPGTGSRYDNFSDDVTAHSVGLLAAAKTSTTTTTASTTSEVPKGPRKEPQDSLPDLRDNSESTLSSVSLPPSTGDTSPTSKAKHCAHFTNDKVCQRGRRCFFIHQIQVRSPLMLEKSNNSDDTPVTAFPFENTTEALQGIQPGEACVPTTVAEAVSSLSSKPIRRGVKPVDTSDRSGSGSSASSQSAQRGIASARVAPPLPIDEARWKPDTISSSSRQQHR